MNPRLKMVLIIGGVVLVVGISALVYASRSRNRAAPLSVVSPETVVTSAPSATATPEATCSPRGTGTCDGNGRPLVQGQGAGGGSQSKQITAEQAGVKTVKLSGVAPQGLDIDPESGLIYTGNNGFVTCKGQSGANTASAGKELSIVDPVKGVETAVVPSAGAAIWPLADIQRNVVYVAGSSGMLAIHERGTGKKLNAVALGPLPHAIGLSTDGTIVVSNTKDGSHKYYAIVNADTQKLVSQQSTGPEYPHSIVYDQAKNVFYMIGVEDGKIAVIDGKTGLVKSTFSANKVNGNSAMMALAAQAKKLFVTVSEPKPGVNIIDTDSYQIVGNFDYSHSTPATSIVVDESRNLLFVVVSDRDALEIYDATTYKSLGYISTGDCPFGVRLDPGHGIGAITNQGDNSLTIFDLTKVKQAVK